MDEIITFALVYPVPLTLTVMDDIVDSLQQYPDFKTIANFADALVYINQRNYAYAQNNMYDEFEIDVTKLYTYY